MSQRTLTAAAIYSGVVVCLSITGANAQVEFQVVHPAGYGIKDAGYPAGRAWIDFDGDGYEDYCRVVGNSSKQIYVTLSTGPGPRDRGQGITLTSGVIDAGNDAGRAWADFNGDGRPDYIRNVGNNSEFVKVSLNTGKGFGKDTSIRTDPGYGESRLWKDVDGDGKADYVRVVGMRRDIIRTSYSNGEGFGQEIDDPIAK